MTINHRLITFALAFAVGVLANVSLVADASEKPHHRQAKERQHDNNRRHHLERKHVKRDRHQSRHRDSHNSHVRRHRDSHNYVKRHRGSHHHNGRRYYGRSDRHFYSGFVLGSVVGHAFGGRDYIRHSDRIHFVRDYDGQCFRVEQRRYRDVWIEVPGYKCNHRRYN